MKVKKTTLKTKAIIEILFFFFLKKKWDPHLFWYFRFSGFTSYLHRLGPPLSRSHLLERCRFASRQFSKQHSLFLSEVSRGGLVFLIFLPRGGPLYNIVALWLLPSPSREWIPLFEVLIPPLSSRELISFLETLTSPFISEELFPSCNLRPRGSLFPSFKCLFHICP